MGGVNNMFLTELFSNILNPMRGRKIDAGNAYIYADVYSGLGTKQYFDNDPIYTILGERGGYYMVRHHSLTEGITGSFKKSDVRILS